MELNFDRSSIFCLDPVLEEIQNSEQTQQIQLPDGMPDVGRILCAWGQAILRGKEWRSDSLTFTGGMMVWVLYAPEDGSAERCIDGWIPFQMRWDLPEGLPEGNIAIHCVTRFTDARPVSARKILVRAGMGAMLQALVPQTVDVWLPGEKKPDLELMENQYPLRLVKEAGEKAFLQDEELTVPDTAPQPEKIICYTIQPRLTERKVLSSKVVFRGSTQLHVLYRTREGRLHSCDLQVPFSQYQDLNGEHSTEAQGEFLLTPTSMELDLDDEGHFRFKCGIAAQYAITDQQPLTLVEDAYSPGYELELNKRILELPVVLETRRETIPCEQNLNWEEGQPVDIRFQADFPRETATDQTREFQLHGISQVLYYGEDGALHCAGGRWEAKHSLPCHQQTQVRSIPSAGEVQLLQTGSQLQLRGELGLELVCSARQGLETLTGITQGQERKREPGRPSLILRRAGGQRLWDLAKESGTTMEAIRKANGLTEEPSPSQLLLIPVP